MQGHAQGKMEGMLEGKVEGKAEGKVEGKIEGLLEGEQAILLRQISHRFGKITAAQAKPLIDAIQSRDVLETIANWVIDCADAEEFLAKLRGI